tara:strand:- start:170 stop:625 length:456 start_codon:yes stop_codon:yes gene_type:complete
MMKKTFLILLLFISSCGYQPIYVNKSIKEFEFKKITLEGDNDVNKKIVNTLSIKENEETENLNRLIISSLLESNEISKNSKGQVELYRTIVNVNLKIINDNNQIIQEKNFSKELVYNDKDNKFSLVEYQNSIKNNLIDKIISDIIIYLNLQ